MDRLHRDGASLSVQWLAEEVIAVGASSYCLFCAWEADRITRKKQGRGPAPSRQTTCSSSLLPSISPKLVTSAVALLW